MRKSSRYARLAGRSAHFNLLTASFTPLASRARCGLGAIYWARPARVFYAGVAADAANAGFDDAFIYEELRRPPESRRIPMTQLMREESLAIFAAWKQLANKTQ